MPISFVSTPGGIRVRGPATVCVWVLLAAACGAGTAPTAGGVPGDFVRGTPAVTSRASPTEQIFTNGRVDISDNTYSPQEITIRLGGTVTWQIATGENLHDVVSQEGFFRSNSPMSRGVDIFTFTFTRPGVYLYVCSYHVPENMTGKVVVK